MEHMLVNCLKENLLERYKKELSSSSVIFKQTLLVKMQAAVNKIYFLHDELKVRKRVLQVQSAAAVAAFA